MAPVGGNTPGESVVVVDADCGETDRGSGATTIGSEGGGGGGGGSDMYDAMFCRRIRICSKIR